MCAFSRFKSSILGKGRDLTVTKLTGTWNKLHPAVQSVMSSSSTVVTSQTVGRKSLTERYTERPNAVQTKPGLPSVFIKLLSVDGKDYTIRMPLEAYKTMDETIGTPDESVSRENVLNVAMLLFMNYVDAATTVAESCGGGGGTSSDWDKDKDENERERARRCAQHAKWLCKPIKRSKGYGH